MQFRVFCCFLAAFISATFLAAAALAGYPNEKLCGL